MLCQNCNDNEANVKYTQIINGVKKQMNLCNKCAKELGIDPMSFDMKMDFSNFLGEMFEDFEQGFIPELIKKEDILCDKCGNSYEDFIKSGKFGCDECYETFNVKIDTLLKNIHGTNEHVGRNGKMINEAKVKVENVYQKEDKKENTKQSKIEKLKLRLKQEIKEERYEDAAKTRDEIKKLEE